MEEINKFLFHCKFEKNLSDKTIKAYTTDLKQFQEFINKNHSINDIYKIGKDELKHYIQFISKFKPKTIKRKIASIKAMFNFLEFEEFIEINPFRKIKLRIKEPSILPKVMNLQEVTQLFNMAYQGLDKIRVKQHYYAYKEIIRDIAVLELLFGTGVRVSELCSLKNTDFGVNFSSIRVNGKGNKERIIQISNKDIKKALRNYYNYFSDIICDDNYFFINKLGNRLSEQSVRLMIKKYRNKCHINKNITPHVFRHTFATLLLEHDVDIKYIQNLLGHSSIVTTQIYTHVSQKKQAKILDNKHPRKDIKFIR